MLSNVPMLAAIALVLVFQQNNAQSSWRQSIMSAAITWGLLLTVLTELLSYSSLLTRVPILVGWVICALVALTYLIRNKVNLLSLTLTTKRQHLQQFSLFLLVAVAVICLVIGVIAWIAPPNNWDSMTYHMSRVMHWQQNKNVQNYPTHIPRQLYQNPWAEFAILHFKLLGGGDRFANFVQWFAMVGSISGVSLLAKEFGATSRGQMIAATACVTLPMGILQGSSTQNDYVAAFWLVCLVHFGLELRKNGVPLYALATGVSLGLAILTKGSAYIFALPTMIWLCLSLFKTRERLALLLILFILIPAIFINVGHYARNFELYQNPLGPGQEGEVFKFSNDEYNLKSLSSNAIRNLALHLGTPFHNVNQRLEKMLYSTFQSMSINPNNPRTTWAGTEFHIIPLSLFEDSAGNLLHLVIIFVTALLLLFYGRKQSEVTIYAICLIGGFLLFSFYLKWQPWHSRLHLPLFVLWSPLVGIALASLRWEWLANLMMIGLLIGCLPFLAANQSRPLLGQDNIFSARRVEMYFRNRPEVMEPYQHVSQRLFESRCDKIGVILSNNEWEYPFWMLLAEHKNLAWRIEHINITNASSLKSNEPQFKNFSPCAVVVVNDNPADELNVGNATFNRVWQENPVSLYLQP